MTEEVKPTVDDCPHCGESFLHDCAYFENDGTVRCPLCDEVTEEKVKPKLTKAEAREVYEKAVAPAWKAYQKAVREADE